MDDRLMLKGSYIRRYISDKRFGFICSPNREDDIFFYITDYLGEEQPRIGEFVDYDLGQDEDGRDVAKRVRVIEDTPDSRYAWALQRSSYREDDTRQSLRDAIKELEKFSSWYDKTDPSIEGARQKLLSLPLATAELADLCVRNGLRQAKDFKDYEKLIQRSGPKAANVAETRTQLESKYPHLSKKIEKSTSNAITLYNRGKNRYQKPTVRKSAIDHRIQAQDPAESWLLFVDETGQSFVRDQYSDSSIEKELQGRFVAVLTHEPTPLDSLKSGTHFVDLDCTAKDKIFQHLLDSPVGVFGITVDDLPETRGDRWMDGVAHVVGWVLRLLSVDGPTEVKVSVEQRGKHDARDSDWDALTRVLLSNLAQTNPERYGKIKLSVQVVKKDDSPYLAYADAIAHTWGSTRKDAKTRRQQSGLLGPCLHQGAGEELMKAWDVLKSGSRLEGEEWRSLVHDPDADEPLGITGILLGQVAQGCREDSALWQRYFEVAQKHIDSKAIDLARLGKEVAWLALCKPEKSSIPPDLELAWRTAELEEKNHRGCIDNQTVARLEELGDELYSEYPGLVCQADLDRAVLATNRFQFTEAGRAVSRWEGKEMAVAGRRHWARVQSQLGQHAAFNEDFDRAEACFAQAIDAFGGMADPDEARMEIAQTATYRAIAAMDNPDCDIETIRLRVGADTGVILTREEIRKMAGNSATGSQYPHHLLLRYLAAHGDPEERNAYLAEREDWSADHGHPWPLIQVYRGMLLRPQAPDDAVHLVVEGYEMAMAADQGPTVQLIGFTIGAIAMAWGSDSLFDKADLLGLSERLSAAEDRINRLSEALDNPPECPERLLYEVLPFNFR